MRKEDLRIVFMGTPEFAVESLRRLVDGGYNVVAVVTQPDKAVGRHGSVLTASPVKEFAISRGLPVLQPVKMKDENFLAELKTYRADLQIVVAFRMLPEVVWAMPRFGTFNVHAALLPQYRGARSSWITTSIRGALSCNGHSIYLTMPMLNLFTKV